MELYKIVLFADPKMSFTTANKHVREAMEWDFFQSDPFCAIAEKKGSVILCFAVKDKAKYYFKRLKSRSLPVQCVRCVT